MKNFIAKITAGLFLISKIALAGSGLVFPPTTGGGGGGGDVTAASSFGNDNRLIRSDGTGKGVQASAITVDDSGNTSGVGSLAASSLSLSGLTASTALALDGSKNVVSVTNTGSGNNVLATSPSLTTPSLGSATATSINGLTINNTTGVLAIGNGKTLTQDFTATYSGTDGSSIAFGAGGTVVYASNNLSIFAPTTSAQLAGIVSDETGSGALVFATSPGFTTAINPVSNDGAALGTTALGWSDIHLATGALINVANGNAVITHSSGIFTVSTGDLRVTTAGTNTASVVTVGGTQNLTGKTLTSPVITTSPTAVGSTWSDLGSVSTVDINGGTLDAVTIGGSSAAAATVTSLSMNNLVTWSAGAAITAGSYQVGRDADATNQFHVNVPTGATMEISVNDVAEYLFSATDLDVNSNSISNIGGTGTDFITGGRLVIGPTATPTGSTALTINQAANTAISVNRPSLIISAVTQTLNSGATIATASLSTLNQPTFNGVAGGGAETITSGANLYVVGPAIQGSDLTLTEPLSIFVDDGISRFDGGIKFSSAGVLITDDSDGAITFASIGDGSKENITINLDDTANTAVFSSSTGVTSITLTSIGITSTADDAGWSIVDQTDNQACTTGCTNACLFGIENATGTAVTNLVSCSTATADLCACMGAN